MTSTSPQGPLLSTDAYRHTGAANYGCGPLVRAALDRLRQLVHQPVPTDLGAWAVPCHVTCGFPLVGAGLEADPYVALQWNGERASRAGLELPDLVVLTGLVTAWEQDRSFGDLAQAVSFALAVGRELAPSVLNAATSVTTDVVTTALCAARLSGVPAEEMPALVDVAGSLMQVRSTPWSGAAAMGHIAAAGWLAAQVHLAGLVAYQGALADTVRTVTFPLDGPCPATPVRELVAGLA